MNVQKDIIKEREEERLRRYGHIKKCRLDDYYEQQSAGEWNEKEEVGDHWNCG